jgi:diguanylate cyclase (GGDEF)-like protein
LIAAASQEAQTLFEMSQSLGNSLSLKETISVMASRLHGLISFDCCALYLKVGDTLVAQHVEGEDAKSFSAQPIAMGEGISGWVAQSGRSILNGNPAVEPSYHSRPGQEKQLHAALSVPLFDLQKDILGVLTLYAAEADSFSRDHRRILQAMESKLSLSLQNALRFRCAEDNAETDFLTNLPNARKLFIQLETELERCRRTGSYLAVIVCDLNSFKEVNDRQGHLAGNSLLCSIADRFRQSCRTYDTIARMGGDEFVFLIPGMNEEASHAKLVSIASTVIEANRRLEVDAAVSASVGAAFFPADGETAEELLALADRRMYLDKQAHYHSQSAELEPMSGL